MSYDRNPYYRNLFARLLTAMSMEDARVTLGFPPGYQPSKSEIQKAYRSLALENHPDRGGSHSKMVALNVAKDILEGRGKATLSPSPARDFEKKKANAIRVITNVRKNVEAAANACRSILDLSIGGTRMPLKAFLTNDLASAIDELQDDVEAAPAHALTQDWKKAEQLLDSLASKATRLSKRIPNEYRDTTLDLIVELGEKTLQFAAAFAVLHEESRKLVALYNTSEDLPINWDITYYRAHTIVEAFRKSMDQIKGQFQSALARFHDALEKGMSEIEDAVRGIDPNLVWDLKAYGNWNIYDDFDWLEGQVRDAKPPSN